MSSDTSAIDNKKETSSINSTPNYASNLRDFFISIIALTLIILLYFSNGGLLLFVCKLAQSNILPTESNCAPYTNVAPIIKPSPIQTNIFTTFTDPEMSMKLQIPYDINSKNKIIDMFTEYKNKSSSNFLANYFIAISEELLRFNYSTISVIMNSINGLLPEMAIIGIGPIVGGFLYIVGMLINAIYFIYLWFSNMNWFFKTNKNTSGEGIPKWESVSFTHPINFSIGIMLSILFSLIFIFGFAVVSFLPLFFYHAALFSTICYKAIMNGKQITSFTIIKETLKYYKLTIISVISLFVVISAFLKLGVVPGIMSLVVLGFIHGGIISIDMFHPTKELNVTHSVSYDQAIKKCASKIPPHEGMDMFDFFGGQRGGKFANQLKKVSKLFNK